MEDHNLIFQPQAWWFDGAIFVRRWWVDTIVAPIESGDDLGEYIPNIILCRIFFLGFELLDDPAKVSTTAVLHVKMDILAVFQVITVVVSNDVRVLK